jgi:hypothetical protein
MRMSRAKVIMGVLGVAVPLVVAMVAHLLPSTPVPVPEGWYEVLRPYPGKSAKACVAIHAVYRDPEPCDVVWLPPEARADQLIQRVRAGENRRRLEALLEHLKAERKLRTE